MRTTLETDILAVASCASTDATRLNLLVVHVTAKHVTASNGHILCRRVRETPDSDMGVGELFIPAKFAAKAVKMAKRAPVVEVEVSPNLSDGGATITARAGGQSISEPLPDYEVVYPDVKSVVEGADKAETTFSIALNPTLLLQAAKALGHDPKANDGRMIRLDFSDAMSCVKVSRPGVEATTLVMPGRL